MVLYAAASLAIGGAACDGGAEEAPGAGALGMKVSALTTESCASGLGNGSALSEISQVTVVVTGIDPVSPEDSAPTVLVNDTRTLAGGSSFTVEEVPQGQGHKLEVLGKTASGETAWYAMEPNLTVLRNEDNPVELLMTRYGGFNCASLGDEKSYTNVVFPAVVTLGDGRIMATGGFTQVDGQDLAGASSQGIIFNPKTGAVNGPFDMGIEHARAGHAMVHIPALEGEGSGHVLIIGGMTRLRMDEKREFPFMPSANKDHVLNTVVLYDIDAQTFTPIEETMYRKRAFPRAARMSDRTVIITGGGDWPSEEDDEYKQVEIFDPLKAGGPGFLDIASFEGEVSRAGHAMAFIKNDENGQSHFLLWGGTKSTPEVAEVLRQSSQQREGVDGSFAQVTEGGQDGESPFSTYFSELTPLAPDEGGRQRFLLTGGARASGTSLNAPADNEAWVLTYWEEGIRSNLSIIRAPGFGPGRVFHTTASSDGRNVSVVGGMKSSGCGDECFALFGLDSQAIRFWDLDTFVGNPSDTEAAEYVDPWSDSPDAERFAPRGAMAGIAMAGGGVLLMGGEADLTAFGTDSATIGPAVIEIYTPSNLHQP